MAMKGLSLDGAQKLKKALDAYADSCKLKPMEYNTWKAYGKETKVQGLMDDIMAYAVTSISAGHNTIASYQNQLNQIINKYQSFDNSGATTLKKVTQTKPVIASGTSASSSTAKKS